MLVLCATGFGTAYQMPALIGIVQGGGDSKFILKNDLISIWGIVIPVSFLAAFVFNWHPAAVVFCLNADQIFKCGAAAIKVNSYTWIKKLTRNEETDKI
jgi:Na+-driven multidrug efflux pump